MPSALYTSLHKKLKEGGSVGASATSQILGTSRRDEHGAALGAIRAKRNEPRELSRSGVLLVRLA